MDQSHYVRKILKKYNYNDYQHTFTPYDTSVELFKNIGESVKQIECARIIDNLRYDIDCIRCDVAYVMRLLCVLTCRTTNEH